MQLTKEQKNTLWEFLGATAKPLESYGRSGSRAWEFLDEAEKQRLREIYHACAPLTPPQEPLDKRVRQRIAKQVEWMGLHGAPHESVVSDRINAMSNQELLQIISEELST